MTADIANLTRQISHGVYVIGVGAGERQNAFTAAWVMQVSFRPLMLAISINPEHYSYRLLEESRVCSVNVLGRDQSALAEHFGRPVPDKMNGHQWQTAETGAPILSDSLAYFDCRLSHFTDAGDHKIAVCTVIQADELKPGKVMLYNQTGNMDGSDELYG